MYRQKLKGKVSVYTMKAYRGNRSTAPFILYLSNRRGKWSASRPGRLTSE